MIKEDIINNKSIIKKNFICDLIIIVALILVLILNQLKIMPYSILRPAIYILCALLIVLLIKTNFSFIKNINKKIYNIILNIILPLFITSILGILIINIYNNIAQTNLFVFINLLNTKQVNNYEVYENSDKFDYKYIFPSNYDTVEPIIYYNDEENNITYIKICTYNDGFKAKKITDEYGNTFKNNKELINSINYTDNKKLIININADKGEKLVEPYLIENDKLVNGDLPYAAEFYIKINNMVCNEIELQVKENKYIAHSSKPQNLKYAVEKSFKAWEKDKKYASICSNGKYGLIDRNGNLIVDFISDREILYKDDMIIINKNGLDYLTDMKGNNISDGYENLAFITKTDSEYAKDYEDYVIIVEICDKNIKLDERLGLYYYGTQMYDRKFGLIDKKGKLIAPPVYSRYYYIFLDAQFRFIKNEGVKEEGPNSEEYIITDLNGNKINNTIYTDIRRSGADGYFIASVKSGILGKSVLINSYGKEISKQYDESMYLANSQIPLFSFDDILRGRKMIDKNGKERFRGFYFETEEMDKNQPILTSGDDDKLLIDDVDVTNLKGIFKIIAITDDEVILKYKQNNQIKNIIIKNGKIIEK